MADSSQKIIKELSELTRNLDVLAKEMRGMNKNTSSVQEAVIKAISKKEPVIDKIVSPSPEKISTENKNGIKGSGEIKKAGLEGIKSAGKALIETRSLKSAAQAGITGILKSGKDSIVEAIRNKREKNKEAKTESITKSEGLKKKERIKKEENLDSEKENIAKEEKKSLLEKLNVQKKSKSEKKKEEGKIAEEKIERKNLLSKIKGKKEEKKEISSKAKEDAEEEKPKKAREKKEIPSLKNIVREIQTEKKLKTKITPEERVKQILEKTSLGSTIKKFSDSSKSKSVETPTPYVSVDNQSGNLSVKSKIEKIGTELKSKFRSKKKEPAKEKSETTVDKESSIQEINKSTETKSSENISKLKSEDIKKDPVKEKDPEISAQDITDIKLLLTSINATLNGPLNIKDNKPYRPQSNMLN